MPRPFALEGDGAQRVAALARVVGVDADGVKVLGPAAAPIAVVRGRHRRRFLLRGAPGVRLQPYLARWLGGLKTPGALRMRVDIDPYSFL